MSDPKIEHRIGVAAPPMVVWDILKDLEAWPSWNPIYTEVRGKLGYGELVHLTCRLPDQASPLTLEATIIEWVPDEQIHWTTKAMAGLVRTTRYIEIDKLTDEACIVSNGEILSGLMAGSVARKYARSMYKGFEAMSEAVKARAEALWIERKSEAAG
jgi:hypothetical protein